MLLMLLMREIRVATMLGKVSLGHFFTLKSQPMQAPTGQL